MIVNEELVKNLMNSIEIKVRTRGIGLDSPPRDIRKTLDWLLKFEKKTDNSFTDNISMFVDSKNDGETIINLVKIALNNEKIGSFLDYRPHEPNWIQVKLFYLDGIDLKKLNEYIRTYPISLAIIKKCIIEDKEKILNEYIEKRLKDREIREKEKAEDKENNNEAL